MSTPRILCDEDIRRELLAAVGGKEPGLEILAVGQPDAPPKETKDPELLLWAEQQGYTLLTRDKRTMPLHVANHLAAGHHTWGVFIINQDRSWKDILENLILIWSASQAEDWQDRIEWIPW